MGTGQGTEMGPKAPSSTEATCETLVEVRLKRAGSRWLAPTAPTGRHVLKLRALAVSDRWPETMDLTVRPLRKSVRVAA